MIKSITGHGSDGMLEHYQQIGADLAADLAGRIQGAGTATLVCTLTEASDAISERTDALTGRIRAIVEQLDGKNWKKTKAALLEALT